MQEQQLKDLLLRISNGTATDADKAFLENWYLQYRGDDNADYTFNERLADAEDVWAKLQPSIAGAKRVKLWPRIAAAASVLLLLSAGGYFILKPGNTNPGIVNDIAPYTSKAILKSGGKAIVLDTTSNGKIAQTVATKSSGQLSYDPVNNNHTVVYDTVQIPAGGRPYTVKLSDGSKITLNAATTLRYPEAFSENRKEEVELIGGEIYAEVVHDAAAPMRIKTRGQLITDIGTVFNIAAYADDSDSRTTLVQGSVKVAAVGKELTLSPGNQAILAANHLSSSPANIMQATAWKDGLFRFNGEHINVIMNQLARWYNIDIKYEGKITSEVFYGRIDRNRNISAVLKILERSNKVHFKVEGRRVTVLSK